jgi:hypothetical protein
MLYFIYVESSKVKTNFVTDLAGVVWLHTKGAQVHAPCVVKIFKEAVKISSG